MMPSLWRFSEIPARSAPFSAGGLISIFQTGSNYMSSSLGVAKEIASLITGILLLFSACGGYFRYLARRRLDRMADRGRSAG